MNIKINITIIVLLIIFMKPTYGQVIKNKRKQVNNVSNIVNSDSLYVAYTYWWLNSGPFVGLCGDEYTLVFLGVVKEINLPDKYTTYISQKGSIEIVEILKTKELKKQKYNGQKYFSSDCFYDASIKKGDKVVVFCYEYNGKYNIPGKNSIFKIDEFDDEVVWSIKKYIEANQDPMAIKNDMELWVEKGFGNELKQIIKCKEVLNKRY